MKPSLTHGKFGHYNADGLLIWASNIELPSRPVYRGSALDKALIEAQPFTPNALYDEGEQDILDVIFRGATAPTSFYFGLWADPGPVETDTLTTLTNEVTGTGYARIAVARNSTDWPTLTLNSGDYQVVSAQKTFTASGTWTAATHLGLVTASTGTAGKVYAHIALSATRTLQNGDSLAVTYTAKLA